MNRVTLKTNAKNQLRGKWGASALATLIYVLVVAAVSAIPVVGWIAGIILSPIMIYGFYYYNYKTSKGEDADIGDLFKGFNNFGTIVGAGLLIGVFTFLWSLLFIIPGIIATFRYSLTYFVLIENPDMSAMDAIRKSKELTYGYKFDIFILMLSFFGWSLLSSLTCGILFLWVLPYMIVTFSNLYKELAKGNPNLQ